MVQQTSVNESKDRISAKNSLESYCFNMQSTNEDENIKSELGETERQTIRDKCKETISWPDANQIAETDEYKDKLKASAAPSLSRCTSSLEVPLVGCQEVLAQPTVPEHLARPLYPQGSGGPNGLFHFYENFIKPKLQWAFQVGQCIVYDPQPLR